MSRRDGLFTILALSVVTYALFPRASGGSFLIEVSPSTKSKNEVPPESIVDIPFSVTNTGTEPASLVIRARGCACLDAQVPSSKLLPQQSATVLFRVAVDRTSVSTWAIVGTKESPEVGVPVRVHVSVKEAPALLVAPDRTLAQKKEQWYYARVDLRVRLARQGTWVTPDVHARAPAGSQLRMLSSWAAGRGGTDRFASAEIRVPLHVKIPVQVELVDHVHGFEARVLLEND